MPAMEATSTYAHPLAHLLYQQGHTVTIANPKQVKAYADSLLVRTKNDRVDACIIAQFCAERRPRAWAPPPPEVEQLQALARRLPNPEPYDNLACKLQSHAY